MLQRFARMVLGLALAMIFAGQTALASDLCGRSALPVMASGDTQQAAAAPCHDAATAQVQPHSGDHHQAPAPQGADHHPCECAAAPVFHLGTQPDLASASVQSWTWRTPGAVAFVSADRTPEGPPPKA